MKTVFLISITSAFGNRLFLTSEKNDSFDANIFTSKRFDTYAFAEGYISTLKDGMYQIEKVFIKI